MYEPGRTGCASGPLSSGNWCVSEHPDVADALDRAGPDIGGELLVPEDGQPFLQAELEPVAAGDAVAGPVVKILMRDDRLDRRIVAVCRRVGQGEDQLGH